MNLLIHADPGARSGFLAAWLTNALTRVEFDSGAQLKPKFFKTHRIDGIDDGYRLCYIEDVKNFAGIKIRIRSNIDQIDLISLLFLRKNVYNQDPTFVRNEYGFESFNKIYNVFKDMGKCDAELDYSLYDYVVDFKDTFDTNHMVNLYYRIVGKMPSSKMVDILIQTNNLNSIQIDKNHVCSILKLIFTKEKELNLNESYRFWSINDIYNTVPVESLYDAVLNSITPENYGQLL